MGCTTATTTTPAFADMSEVEQVQAALANITEAFAMAIAQRPQYTAMAIDLMRMVEAGEHEELAALGADMCDRIGQVRVGEAH